MPPLDGPVSTAAQNNSRRLRVGIAGAGWVAGDRHLPAYLAHPGVDVVAVHDRRRDRAARLASRTSPVLATDSWDEFLAQDLDLMSICTPPFAHAGQATAALSAGVNVFLEKPMAMDASEACAIAEASRANERLLCVSHNFLFSRSMLRLRRVLDSGDAGAVRFVMGMQASSPARRLPTWYGDLPAGLFFDESPHLLYLVAGLLGELSLVSATAERNGEGGPQPVRSVHAVLASPTAPATLTMCFDAPVSEWHLIVVCERRVLMADLFRDISVVLGPDGQHGAMDILKTSASTTLQHFAGFASSGTRLLTKGQHWGHRTLIHRVVDAVQQGRPSPVPVEESLQVTRLTDAILGAIS